ncbi:MAG: AtpZ/AtpI family protein [Desulforhopalus sp.]
MKCGIRTLTIFTAKAGDELRGVRRKWVDKMSDVKKEFVQLLANYGHIGFTFVAAILIGLGGGIYLDQKVFDGRTAPWFTFIGLAFGIAAGYKSLLEILWRNKKIEDKDDHEK